MALYGLDFYGASRYGPRIFLDFDASPMRAVARRYGEIDVSWSSPGGNWSILRVVRNAYGTPVSQNDGRVLVQTNSGPAATGTADPPRNNVVDADLVGGRFYYYAVWLYVPAIDEWTRAAYTIGLAVSDYRYTSRLWELTPSIHRTVSGALLEQDNETLRTFYKIPGFQLDHIRAEYETLRNLNDPYRVSGGLLPVMAQQYGQFFEPELGMAQMRKLLASTVYLYRNKGTTVGVEGFVKAVSGYGAKIQPLKNLMLDYNDSSFEESIGRWYSPNATITRYLADDVVAAPELYEGMRRVGLLQVTSVSTSVTLQCSQVGVTDNRLHTIPVEAGKPYSFSFYSRAATVARGTYGEVWWIDKNGVYLSTSLGAATTNAVGTWTRHTANNLVAPAGAVYVIPVIRMSTTAAGEVHYYDALQFEPGTVATDYEDARLIDVNVLAPRVNEATNPSFETSLVGWTGAAYRNILTANQSSVETDTAGWANGTNGTVGRSTAQALHGTASMTVTANGVGTASVATSFDAAQAVKVVPGQVYTVVASFRAAVTPRATRVLIRWGDATGAYLGQSLVDGADRTTGWEQVRLTAQAPATAERATLVVYALNCAAGEVHYVDGVGLFADPLGNLLPNPDFESGTSGWTISGAGVTAAASTEQAYTGRQSAKLVGVAGVVGQFRASNLAMQAGKTYTAAVWVKRTAGTANVRLTLAMGNEAVVQSVDYTAANGTWQRLVATITPTADITNGYLRILTDGGPVTVYVDAAMLTATSSAVEYVPPQTHNLQIDSSAQNTEFGNYWQLGYGGRTRAQMTDGGYVGTTYMRMGPATNTDSRIASLGLGGFRSMFAAGEWTTVSMYVRHVSGPIGTGYTLNGGTAPLSATPVTNGWVRVQTTFLGVPNADQIALSHAGLTGAQANEITTDVDAIQVERGSVATAYVDGSTGPAAKWNASENMISNSSFETDTAGWEGLNKNLLSANQSSFETDVLGWESIRSAEARTTVAFYNGTASMQLACDGTGDAWVRTDPYGTGGSRINVVPGQVYTLTAYVRAATTPRLAHIRVTAATSAANEAFAFAGDAAGPDTAVHSTGWAQLTMVWQAPANVKSISPGIYIKSPAANEVHYVDAVSVMETPNANLVTNPDFENGTAGWVAHSTGTTLAQSTARAWTGRASLLTTWGTHTAHNAAVKTQTVNVTAGVTYTASAWVFVPAGSPDVATYAAAAVAYGYGTTTATKDAWVRVTHTFTPTSTRAADIGVVAPVATTSGQQVYVDAVQVVVGSEPVDYLPPTTHNLWTNPSVEVNSNGYSDYNTTPTRSTETAYVGTTSLRFVTAGANQGTARYSVPVEVGRTYTVSAYVKRVAGTAGDFRIDVWDAVGAGNIYPQAATVSFDGTWQRSAVTFTAREAVVHIYFAERSGASVTWHMDAVQLEQGSVATPYVDGSLGAGYAWETSDNMVSNSSFEVDTAGWEGLNKNLLGSDQSSFETGTGGWGGSGCTIARVTTQAFQGTASLEMTSTAAGEFYIGAAGGPIVPGQVYTFNANFRAASTARQTGWYINWYKADGSMARQDSIAVAADNSAGWTAVPFTSQAPADAVTVSIFPRVFNAVVGEIHYVDAISMFETPNANLVRNPDFENGTTGWGVFTGSAPTLDASASYTGRASLSYTAPGSGGDNVYTTLTTVGGVTYTVSGYFRRTGTIAGGYFRVYSEDSGASATQTAIGAAGVWQRVSHTFTAADASTQVYFALNGLSGQWNLDAVQVVVGSEPVEYLPPTTSNLVPNPSFEVDLAGYSASSVTAARDTTWKYVGAASLSLTRPAGATTTDGFAAVNGDIGGHRLGMVPGGTYTASAYLRVPSTYTTTGENGRARGICVHWRTAAGYSSRDSNKIAPGSEGRVSVTFTIPADATESFIRLYNGSATDGDVVYWDAIQLEQGSVATPYVDGSLGAGYAWESSENLYTPDPGFNVDATGINPSSANVTVSHHAVAGGFEGTGYAGLTWAAAAYTDFNSQHASLSRSIFNLLPGETRTWSIYTSMSTAPPAGAVPQLHITGSNGIAQVALPTNTSGWQRTVVTYTNTTTATMNIGFYITLNGGAAVTTAAAFTLYLDAAQIEAKPYATPYAQAGTAHASTSRRSTPWVLGGTSLETMIRKASGGFAGGAFLDPGIPAILNIPGSSGNAGAETRVSVAPNTTYTLGTAFQGAGAIRVRDAATNALLASGGSAGGIATRGTFLTFTTGSATTSVRIQGVWAGSGDPAVAAAGGAFYLDAVQLEQKPYATAFESTGTAHASTSRRSSPWVLGGTWLETLNRASYFGAAHGTYAVEVLRPSILATPNWIYGLETKVNVAPNTTYTVSASHIHSQGSFRVLDGATNAVLGTHAAQTTGGGGSYGRAVVPFTTGSATTSVRVQHASDPARVSTTIRIDAVQLEQRPFATAFQAPGTAHASTSTRQSPWTLGGSGATTLTREAGTSGVEGAGSYILRVDHVDGVGSGAVHDVVLAPYTTYTISAWTKTPAGEPPAVLQVSSGGVVVATGNAAAGTADVWERVSLTFTTTGATLYSVGVIASSATNVSHNFWVDAVLFEKSAGLLDYFDGTTYAFTGESIWEGTPNLSRSHYYPQRRTKNYRMQALLKEYTPLGSSYRLNYAQPL